VIWFVLVIALLIIGILLILFLNRFYRKSSREVALVRTGAGGQRIVLDGGCLSLPFLHKVSEVNMKTTRLEVERTGSKSIITKDRLRVDAAAEFYVRVQPNEDGVATAAQALGSKTFRAAELADTLEGKLADAMLSVASDYSMDSLQDERGKYVAEVSKELASNLAANGLVLESVSLTRLDQTPFNSLDENNAFNSLGMRRLAEIIASNKKARAAIEADAEVSVRQSELDATKRRLMIEQEEEQAAIEQQRKIETSKADSQAEISRQQSQSELRREEARIAKEQEVRTKEIERDRTLRELDVEANLATESAKIDKAIALADKAAEEARIKIGTEAVRAEAAAAEESVLTAQSVAAAERERKLALVQANEQADVDETRVRSEGQTVRTMADADAAATRARAEAKREQLLAHAHGTEAVVHAENMRNPEQIKMKVDLARIDALPDLVGQMMKPAEKIETIRINQVSGFNGSANASDSTSRGNGAVNEVVDGVMSMALQLPAVKKLGEEVGLNIGGGIAGLSDSIDNDNEANTDAEPVNPESDSNSNNT